LLFHFSSECAIRTGNKTGEKKALRRIFGTKRDEVTGGWRKLYNGKLNNLYTSESVIKMIMSRRV
jgi:hypothetical protein